MPMPWILGINPLTVLGLLGGSAPVAVRQHVPAAKPAPEDKLARFVATVRADIEEVWREQCARASARRANSRRPT
jgi:predicted metalloprotease